MAARTMVALKQYSVEELTRPATSSGRTSNWIPTATGKPYFVLFRIYGPTKGSVDGSWILNDIERAQ